MMGVRSNVWLGARLFHAVPLGVCPRVEFANRQEHYDKKGLGRHKRCGYQRINAAQSENPGTLDCAILAEQLRTT